MEIARRNRRENAFSAAISKRDFRAIALKVYGQVRSRKTYVSHIHFRNERISLQNTNLFGAAFCVYNGQIARYSAVFRQNFGNRAYGVPAHISLCSVGVEHNHFAVERRAVLDENHSVAAHSEMSVGQNFCKLRFVKNSSVEI